MATVYWSELARQMTLANTKSTQGAMKLVRMV